MGFLLSTRRAAAVFGLVICLITVVVGQGVAAPNPEPAKRASTRTARPARQGKTHLPRLTAREQRRWEKRLVALAAEKRRKRAGQSPDHGGHSGRPRHPEWIWPKGPYRPMRFPQRPLQIRGLDPVRRRDPETGGTGVIRSTTFTPPGSMLGFTPQEPTVANSGDIFFCTGNLFAGVSSDGGRTWTTVNPGTIFGTNAAGPVCCDQIVRYLPDYDRFVWIIQYQTNAGSEENAYRIAYASPRDVVAGNWAWVDYTSAGLGQSGRFLDFPDLAFGNAYAYFSFNVFPNDDGSFSVGSAVARIPLSGFLSGDFSDSRVFSEPSGFTLRIAQNTGSDAHFFSTVNTSTVRIYNWPEFSNDVSKRDVGVASFRNSGYGSLTPADGSGNQYDWLGSANQRALGCARARGQLWMAWNCAKDPGNGKPNSYVRLAVVNESDWSVALERDYFSDNYASAYPALAVNGQDDVAISFAFGGATRMPGYIVGFASGTDHSVFVAEGTHGPQGARWGDYHTIAPYHPDGRLFVTASYTHQGSALTTSCVTRFFIFGRQPITHIDSPNGGESISAETTFPIRWGVSSSSASVSLDLSRDSGFSWQRIVTDTPNDGSFDWNVTGPGTTTALIRVTNSGNSIADDRSDRVFTIVQPGDVYEPDQFIGESKFLSEGNDQNRSIHNPTNKDLVRVELFQRSNVRIISNNLNGPGDIQLALFSFDGTNFTQIGPTMAETAGQNRVELRAADLAPTTYYLLVEELGNDQIVNRYDLALRLPQGDFYEPDDRPEDASPISSGETQDRTFHFPSNLNPDYAYFDVTTPSNVQIETTPGTPGLDTELVLSNSEGAGIGFDDDSGTDQYSRILAYNLRPGRYYIRVLAKTPSISQYRLAMLLVNATPPTAAVLKTLEVLPSPLRIRLEWDDNSLNDEVVEVWRSANRGKFFLRIQMGAPPGTGTVEVLDNIVDAATTYTYFIRTINVAGHIDSNQKEVTTPGGTGLSPPTNFRAIAVTDKSVFLTWTDTMSSETGFKIERATAPTGPYKSIGVAPSVVGSGGLGFHLDSSKLAASKRFFYRISAVRGRETSPPTGADATTLAAGRNALLSPTSLTLTTRMGTTTGGDLALSNPFPFPLSVGVGTLAAPFTSTRAGTNVTLNPSANETVRVNFAPTSAKRTKGSLKLTVQVLGAGLGTYTVAITGVGTR